MVSTCVLHPMDSFCSTLYPVPCDLCTVFVLCKGRQDGTKKDAESKENYANIMHKKSGMEGTN